MSYHRTESPAHHAWQAGDVVVGWEGAFSHCVILGFDDAGRASLARPYVYASSAGTTCATPLTGVETIDFVDLTRGNWTKVTSGRVV